MRWDAELRELVKRQCGFVLRGQALAAGLSRGAISWQLNRGHWRRVVPALYATFTGELSDEQRLVAAALHGGPGAQITGAAALRWHGVRYAPADTRVHILVPEPQRRSSQAFIRVTRTTRPDTHARLRPILEVCSVSRAGADAARVGYPLREVRAFLAEIIQRRLATLPMLEAEVRDGPSASSTALRRVVGELRAGIRSAPEAELREIVEASVILPPAQWNPALVVAADGTELPAPDGWIQDVGLALELNSWEHHAMRADWHRTLSRQNELSVYGVLTLQFTPDQIRKEPTRVRTLIERAYRERSTGFNRVISVDR